MCSLKSAQPNIAANRTLLIWCYAISAHEQNNNASQFHLLANSWKTTPLYCNALPISWSLPSPSPNNEPSINIEIENGKQSIALARWPRALHRIQLIHGWPRASGTRHRPMRHINGETIGSHRFIICMRERKNAAAVHTAAKSVARVRRAGAAIRNKAFICYDSD